MRAVVSVITAPARYGAGALAFHWTVAGLIVFQRPWAPVRRDSEGGAAILDQRPRLRWLISFALVIARLLWRAAYKAPDLPPDVGEFRPR
jgi:cytochrome b561